MRPVCEVCGRECVRVGWRDHVGLFRCCNAQCSDFGKRIYSLREQVESTEPDGKEK